MAPGGAESYQTALAPKHHEGEKASKESRSNAVHEAGTIASIPTLGLCKTQSMG